MSPDDDDHGDVLFIRVFAGKFAELKWYQNVRSLLTTVPVERDGAKKNRRDLIRGRSTL